MARNKWKWLTAKKKEEKNFYIYTHTLQSSFIKYVRLIFVNRNITAAIFCQGIPQMN